MHVLFCISQLLPYSLCICVCTHTLLSYECISETHSHIHAHGGHVQGVSVRITEGLRGLHQFRKGSFIINYDQSKTETQSFSTPLARFMRYSARPGIAPCRDLMFIFKVSCLKSYQFEASSIYLILRYKNRSER